MPKSKKARKERRKSFKIDNEDYLNHYIQFVHEGGEYWDDWHKRCIHIFSYREEEVDGALLFHNEENEGAELTLASVKSRFTREEKKWNSWTSDPANQKDTDEQIASGMRLPRLKNRPKPKAESKRSVDYARLFKLAKSLDVLVPPSAEEMSKMDGE